MTHVLKTQTDGKHHKVLLFFRQGKQGSISPLCVASVLNNNNLCS